jgi:hypothetical protein
MPLPAPIQKPDKRARVEVEKELSWIASLLFRFCGDWLGYRYRDLSARVLSGLPSLSLLNSCSMKKPGCASQIDQEYLQHNKLIATGKPMSRVGHHPRKKPQNYPDFVARVIPSSITNS